MNEPSVNINDAIVLEQDKFVWETPSFQKYERGASWYLVMGVCALLLIAYAIWSANFLFAFIILLVVILFAIAGHELPQRVLVQIGDNGIVWNGKMYHYRDLENFTIVYQPPYTKVLYIEPKSSVSPRIRINIEEQDPVQLREHLCQYVTENMDLQNEHLSDIVGRLLKI